MMLATGTFTGDAARRVISLAFKPLAIYVKGNHAVHGMWHTPNQWTGRSVGMGAAESLNNNIRFHGNDVYLGTDTRVCANGVSFIWFAIGHDTTGDLEHQSWLGNATAGRTVTLQSGMTPKALWIKRDSPLPMILRAASVQGRATDGTVVAEGITALGAGSVTLGALTAVNQYVSATGVGEGIDGIFVSNASLNCEVVTWTGNAVNGRAMNPASLTNVVAAWIFRTDATQGNSARLAIVPTCLPVGPNAAVAGDPVLSSTGLTLGTAFGNLNTVTYCAIFFGGPTGTPATPTLPITDGRQAIYLPGRDVDSRIDCGDDDSLAIVGSMSVEWFGIPYYHWAGGAGLTEGVPGQLIGRGEGPLETNDGYSWGTHIIHKDDDTFPLDWPGPQYTCVVGVRLQFEKPLDTCCWRTGVIAKYGKPVHVVTTYDTASGRWRYFVNGVLVKQRAQAAPTIDSTTAQRTGIGAWRDSGVWSDPLRMAFISARVYDRELTLAEVATRYAIETQESADPDVTSGLVEAWDAADATGTDLPAQVDPANDGVIVLGELVTL